MGGVVGFHPQQGIGGAPASLKKFWGRILVGLLGSGARSVPTSESRKG